MFHLRQPVVSCGLAEIQNGNRHARRERTRKETEPMCVRKHSQHTSTNTAEIYSNQRMRPRTFTTPSACVNLDNAHAPIDASVESTNLGARIAISIHTLKAHKCTERKNQKCLPRAMHCTNKQTNVDTITFCPSAWPAHPDLQKKVTTL